ncbi:MAG TPA: sialate O-acetylesterase [Opitutaceae bacterium]|nr:sialate O-acetylesterase [Opitutaceae bacterium]
MAILAAKMQAAPVEVYLIGGQSNATGQGYVKNLPAGFVVDSRVMLFHSGPPHLHGAGPANAWHELQPASESPDRFGPELGFGNRLQQLRAGKKLALIKHAHSGTNLFAQWAPGENADDRAHWGPQFTLFVDTVEAGLKALRERGDEPVIMGMIWHQGEADADRGGAVADAYAENLTHFIARIREQFHAPALPFIYALITRPPEKGPARDLVRQAQRDLAESSKSGHAVRGAVMIDTDDLSRRAEDPGTPYPKDQEHIGSAGMLTLGMRMADAMNRQLEHR